MQMCETCFNCQMQGKKVALYNSYILHVSLLTLKIDYLFNQLYAIC